MNILFISLILGHKQSEYFTTSENFFYNIKRLVVIILDNNYGNVIINFNKSELKKRYGFIYVDQHG